MNGEIYIEAWVRRKYAEGWEISVDNEILPLSEAVPYFLSESRKVNNEFIVDVQWDKNGNR